MHSLPLASHKARLRQELRQQRRQLEPGPHQIASRKVCARICRLPLFWRSRSIALYLATDGEVDLHYLLQAAWRARKHTFLPVVTGKHSMSFCYFRPGDRLRRSRYGMTEPLHALTIDPAAIDLIVTPLVAFDRLGQRLGRGGGYYDRALPAAQKYARQSSCIGAAFSFQELDEVPSDSWDRRLHSVVTEKETIVCTHAHSTTTG